MQKTFSLNTKFIILLIIYSALWQGCKKYLDAKTDKTLVEPSSLDDAQALLDNYTQMNTFYPSIAEESEDDHFLLTTDFNALSTSLQNDYTWDKDAFFNNADVSWKFIYANILYANMALETVANTSRTTANAGDWDRIKGEALFFRAFNLFYAMQYWAVPYDSATAPQVLGVPIRLTSDVNEPITRPPLQQCYNQAIDDYTGAIRLLPVSHSLVFRPSRAAAFGALARLYLVMGNYTGAAQDADSCLQLYNALIDYNTINPAASTPFRSFNDEVIFHAETLQNNAVYSPTAKTDTALYNLYDSNDLRKSIFFYSSGDGYHSFKGSYAGSNYYDVPFIGIATDEQYLVLAESYARVGFTDKAMAALNTLLAKRWAATAFVPFTTTGADDALQKILVERHKELVGRGMRWLDLRRLNKDTRYAQTITRSVNGVIYKLQPTDPRYTFYIPDIVVKTSGVAQNSR